MLGSTKDTCRYFGSDVRLAGSSIARMLIRATGENKRACELPLQKRACRLKVYHRLWHSCMIFSRLLGQQVTVSRRGNMWLGHCYSFLHIGVARRQRSRNASWIDRDLASDLVRLRIRDHLDFLTCSARKKDGGEGQIRRSGNGRQGD